MYPFQTDFFHCDRRLFMNHLCLHCLSVHFFFIADWDSMNEPTCLPIHLLKDALAALVASAFGSLNQASLNVCV